jgi:hypothetical protein
LKKFGTLFPELRTGAHFAVRGCDSVRAVVFSTGSVSGKLARHCSGGEWLTR